MKKDINKKIIVLAGNRMQFERYLDENGLTDSEAIYGWCADVLRGVIASKVVEYGTYYEKADAFELKREAKSRVR